MPINFNCPNADCEKTYSIPIKYAGKKTHCEACGIAVTIPGIGVIASTEQRKNKTSYGLLYSGLACALCLGIGFGIGGFARMPEVVSKKMSVAELQAVFTPTPKPKLPGAGVMKFIEFLNSRCAMSCAESSDGLTLLAEEVEHQVFFTFITKYDGDREVSINFPNATSVATLMARSNYVGWAASDIGGLDSDAVAKWTRQTTKNEAVIKPYREKNIAIHYARHTSHFSKKVNTYTFAAVEPTNEI